MVPGEGKKYDKAVADYQDIPMCEEWDTLVISQGGCLTEPFLVMTSVSWRGSEWESGSWRGFELTSGS